MKEIPLSQGKVALVDDEDYDYLMQWKWHVLKKKNTYYAVRLTYEGNGKKRNSVRMHRLIMNTPPNMEVDHKDHNGLNCQKYNLRNCTIKQNRRNKKASGRSRYIGVSINKRGYITSRIEKDNIHFYLGSFKTEEDAAMVYNKKAIELFGEFANINLIEVNDKGKMKDEKS